MLAGLLGEPGRTRWFATTGRAGYYADPATGGNVDGRSWRMLGWTPARRRLAGRGRAAGGPAGGHRAADVRGALRRGGDRLRRRRRRGGLRADRGRPDGAAGRARRLPRPRLPRRATTCATPGPTSASTTGPWRPRAGNPRTLEIGGRDRDRAAWDPRWGSNAYTVGGGTRVYGAQAWRFVPEDFRMASTYGVPEGSALADWPISYDDLEPLLQPGGVRVGVSGGDRRRRGPGARVTATTRCRRCRSPRPARLLADGRRRRLGDRRCRCRCAINSDALRRPAGLRALPAVRRLRLPGRGEERLATTPRSPRAAATGRLRLLLGTRAERS